MKNTEFAKWVIIASGAVPIAMMVWDALDSQLGPDPTTKMLHITGIMSVIFLGASLCVTPLRAFTGKNFWSLYRRTLGVYAFFYALLHLGIWMQFDRHWDFVTAFQRTFTWRPGLNGSPNYAGPFSNFIFLGMAAFWLMAPLAITSTNGAIKKMGAKKWKLLHKLTYVITALAILHILLGGNKSAGWVEWTLTYALGALLAYRLVVYIKGLVEARSKAAPRAA